MRHFIVMCDSNDADYITNERQQRRKRINND